MYDNITATIDYAFAGPGRGRNINVKYKPSELRDVAIRYCEFMRARVWNRAEVVKGGEMAGTIYEVPTSTPLELSSFLIFAAIGQTRWNRYRDNVAYAEVCEWIETLILSQNLEGAFVGAYNANLVARRHKLAEKTETTADIRVEQITGMEVT